MVEKFPRDRFRYRDYTRPPSRSRPHAAGSHIDREASPTSPAQHSTKPSDSPVSSTSSENKVRISRKKPFLFFAILLMVVAGGGFALKEYKSNINPVPASITRQTNFDVLYPAWLPEGFKLNQDSYKYDSEVLTYSADSESGKKLVFSVQKKPANLDLNKFYKQELENVDEFSTSLGQAATGKLLGQPTATLVSGNSWLFIRPLGVSVSPDTLKQIVLSVK